MMVLSYFGTKIVLGLANVNFFKLVSMFFFFENILFLTRQNTEGSSCTYTAPVL